MVLVQSNQNKLAEPWHYLLTVIFFYLVALHAEEGWSVNAIITICVVIIPLGIINITSAIWYHQVKFGKILKQIVFKIIKNQKI